MRNWLYSLPLPTFVLFRTVITVSGLQSVKTAYNFFKKTAKNKILVNRLNTSETNCVIRPFPAGCQFDFFFMHKFRIETDIPKSECLLYVITKGMLLNKEKILFVISGLNSDFQYRERSSSCSHTEQCSQQSFFKVWFFTYNPT